jgi:acetate kinase
MRVLVLNCGSSSLKFGVFDVEPAADKVRRVVGGTVQWIGGVGTLTISAHGETVSEGSRPDPDHPGAVRWMAESLERRKIELRGVEGVGHRVVHGGDRFREATRIDPDVLAGIEAVSELAPLHNRPSLSGIRAIQSLVGDRIPMVAVFDTAFHHTLPPHAST